MQNVFDFLFFFGKKLIFFYKFQKKKYKMVKSLKTVRFSPKDSKAEESFFQDEESLFQEKVEVQPEVQPEVHGNEESFFQDANEIKGLPSVHGTEESFFQDDKIEKKEIKSIKGKKEHKEGTVGALRKECIDLKIKLGSGYTCKAKLLELLGRQDVKKTKKKDENKPKRPITSFFIFSNENRKKVAQNNKGVAPTGISKKLGEMWENLDPEEKEPFETEAKEYSQIYKKEKEQYDKETKGPKRGRSAYIFFCMDKYKEEDIKALESRERVKTAAKLWKKTKGNEKERLPYILLAEKDKERYVREKFEWNGTETKVKAKPKLTKKVQEVEFSFE